MSKLVPALKTLPLGLLLAFTAACKNVPIDTSDASGPQVTIYMKNSNGAWVDAAGADYGNNTAMDPLEIKAVVIDPQGVKSNDLRFSDNTVDVAYCSGALYNGNWVVAGLPDPVTKTASGSGGKAPTKCTTFMTIDGILPIQNNPPGVNQTCFPANNTTITLRCRGTNWSADPAVSTQSDYFALTFKF